MTNLFESDEYETYLRRAAENPRALEILTEIFNHGLVRKKKQKTFAEKREKALQEWQMNTNQVRKPLPIHIYQKGSFVWYKYPYRFCKSKVVEGSTNVRVKPLCPLPKHELRVPDLREFRHLLWVEDDGWFLYQLRVTTMGSTDWMEQYNVMYDAMYNNEWAPKFKFFGNVESPRALLAKLLDLEADHYMRLFEETRQAIEEGREPSLIMRMKNTLRYYSPSLYQIIGNGQRIKMGKEPIQMVTDLMKIEEEEKRLTKKE